MRPRRSSWIALLLLTLAGAGSAAAQENAPTPAPGSAGIFRANAELQAQLRASIAEGNEPATAAITRTDAFRGSLVRRTEPNGAIAHPGNIEMHYIIEGSGTIETGGTIVRTSGSPSRIEGGETRRVVVGDIIVIPEGSAHRYSQVDEPITYLEFRFVAPE